MLITEEYREQNALLHGTNENYGKFSSRWAEMVMGMCVGLQTNDVLDYGCGKASLNLHLPFSVHNYDPAVPKWAAAPAPADIVVCTDVLEHIEPECLDEVLDHLCNVTKRVTFLNVATRPAVKTLADGRNAHLIQEPYSWWEPKIRERWEIEDFRVTPEEFNCVCVPKHATD